MSKLIVGLLLISLSIHAVPASANDASSPLTKQQQSAAKRGNNYAGSNKADKAQGAYQLAIDQATSVEQCLAIIKSTEHYGSILSTARRNCLTKAFSLAKTDEDYFAIITAARQCQFYEMTKQCIDALIAAATTKDQLLALAHKSQSMAANDVAHIAMERLYKLIELGQGDAAVERSAARSRAQQNGKNAEEASLEPTERVNINRLSFAKQAKLMAMEDLMRKAVKDILDNEQSAHELCILSAAIGPLEIPDLQRKILRKAVYQVTSVQDCQDVCEYARRLGQQDIVELAAFKGRKMILIQQANGEQEAVKEQQENLKQEQDAREAEANGLPPPPKPDAKSDGKPAPVGPGF